MYSSRRNISVFIASAKYRGQGATSYRPLSSTGSILSNTVRFFSIAPVQDNAYRLIEIMSVDESCATYPYHVKLFRSTGVLLKIISREIHDVSFSFSRDLS